MIYFIYILLLFFAVFFPLEGIILTTIFSAYFVLRRAGDLNNKVQKELANASYALVVLVRSGEPPVIENAAYFKAGFGSTLCIFPESASVSEVLLYLHRQQVAYLIYPEDCLHYIQVLPALRKLLKRVVAENRASLRYDPYEDNYLPTSFLVEEVERAVATGDMSMVYLPKAEISSGKVVGMEALVRVSDIKASPRLFIPRLSPTTLNQLTSFVLRTVVRDFAFLKRAGAERVSINLSPTSSFSDKEGAEHILNIAKVLATTNYNPSEVVIEFSEEDFNDTAFLKTAVCLSAIGIPVSVSGTCIDCPITPAEVKLRLNDIRTQTVAELTRTVAFWRERGVNVCATGVETPEELALAAEVGCTHYQGFLLSKPYPLRYFWRE